MTLCRSSLFCGMRLSSCCQTAIRNDSGVTHSDDITELCKKSLDMPLVGEDSVRSIFSGWPSPPPPPGGFGNMARSLRLSLPGSPPLRALGRAPVEGRQSTRPMEEVYIAKRAEHVSELKVRKHLSPEQRADMKLMSDVKVEHPFIPRKPSRSAVKVPPTKPPFALFVRTENLSTSPREVMRIFSSCNPIDVKAHDFGVNYVFFKCRKDLVKALSVNVTDPFLGKVSVQLTNRFSAVARMPEAGPFVAYVSKIPPGCSEGDITRLFENLGLIDIHFFISRKNDRIAFVYFTSREHLLKAMDLSFSKTMGGVSITPRSVVGM